MERICRVHLGNARLSTTPLAAASSGPASWRHIQRSLLSALWYLLWRRWAKGESVGSASLTGSLVASAAALYSLFVRRTAVVAKVDVILPKWQVVGCARPWRGSCLPTLVSVRSGVGLLRGGEYFVSTEEAASDCRGWTPLYRALRITARELFGRSRCLWAQRCCCCCCCTSRACLGQVLANNRIPPPMLVTC